MSMTRYRAAVSLLLVGLLVLGGLLLPGSPAILQASAAEAEEAQPAQQLTAWSFSNSDVVKLYARDYQDNAYVPVDPSLAGEIVDLIRKAGQGQAEEIYSRTDGGFFMELSDGSKYSYTMVYAAVRVGTQAYPLSQEDYSRLQILYNSALEMGSSYVQWLAYMTPSRVASITYNSTSSLNARDVPAGKVLEFAEALAYIPVKKGSGTTFSDDLAFAAGPGRMLVKVTFGAGIDYEIMIDGGNTLYIRSSDMTYGCAYELENATVVNLSNKLDAIAPNPNLW